MYIAIYIFYQWEKKEDKKENQCLMKDTSILSAKHILTNKGEQKSKIVISLSRAASKSNNQSALEFSSRKV